MRELYEMKKIILLLILIISSFTLTACSQSADLESENFSTTFQSDISSEETLSSEELPSNDTEWQDKIDVLFEQIEDNILGYSLIRTAQELSYIRDADYLIEDAVGNGIFVSEHMAETEAFLGQLLMDALDRRGEIAQENRTYFTDWAAQQLAETNWKLLDQEWTPNKYAYDRFYTLSHIWGDVGYEFTYTIYADNASMTKPETQAAQVKLSVDDNGMICGINVDIYFVDQEHSGVFHTENTTMLYYDEYPEQIVGEGVQLACGDTAADAEQFGELVINALESRGEDAAYDKELFADEASFQRFLNHHWEQLENHWKANRFYDCYRIHTLQESEGIAFLYYIYPDYAEMDIETAKAITFRCYVDAKSGKITNTELSVISMTQKQYQTAKEYLGKRILVIENGKIWGGGDAPIPVPAKTLTPMHLKDYLLESSVPKNSLEKQDGSRIYTKEELQPYLFGKRLWKELADGLDPFGITKMSQNWQIKEGYDCYYYNHNQRSGSNHYRYYFYWEKADEEQEQVLLLDTWVSENEIVAMEHGWFMEDIPKEKTDSTLVRADIVKEDIAAFLTFDWTADSVLWEHSLLPGDSAQGWEFSVADIDFDGSLEMLVTFPANHCGQNCLYVYKQDRGEVYSYADTYAVFDNHINCKTDYKKRLPYLDIKLLDAYVNENNEYKYLSLDNSSFGGDLAHGGIYTLYLYETALDEATEPKLLVEIFENWPEEKREMYFRGEKIYELGALREHLAAYMDGYTKREINYRTAKEMFPRDLLGWSDAEKRQELELLYDALLDMTNYRFEKETGRILHQETEEGNVVILYDKQDHVIAIIDVIEKTSILQLTDNLFEIVQSVGSPARYVFYYDAQTYKISDVFFNPILIENQYIAYIENGELIIRDIFDEGTFCKKITRDFTETADPTSAIISITLEKEGQFVIEYYQGEDYKMETEIISE